MHSMLWAMLPFLFAALTMLSVGKAAQGIIVEVRRQLDDPNMKELRYLAQQSENEDWNIDDIKTYSDMPAEVRDGKTDEQAIARFKEVKPDYNQCIAICTTDSLKEMLLPGALAIFTPLGVGLLVGAKCLGGLLMGAIATGFLLAVMMNNAGGAWDNSKKYVENEGPTIKISENKWEVVKKKHRIHKAVVTGDTVGDPFKDTSGPALNILIKLMSVLSLTCAGLFRDDWDTWWVGIIVLIVEAVACGIIFWFVWAGAEEEPDPKNIVTEAEVEVTMAPPAESVELEELKKQNSIMREELDKLRNIEKA